MRGDYDYNFSLSVVVLLVVVLASMALGGLLLALFGFGLLT